MNDDAFREMLAHERDHWWYRARREILQRVIERRVGRVGCLLEIGCGTGANLQMLSGFGSVEGIENSAFAREYAASRGFSVRDGRLPDGLPQELGSFDAVCMFDVLEHIECDLDALIAVRRLLKPGGRIVLSVPAYQWLFGQHDIRLHHYRRYTRGNLHALLRRAGFAVSWSSHFNSLLFLPAAAVRFASRLVGRRSKPPGPVAPNHALPVGNRLLYRLFASERWLTDMMPIPFGLSIVAIAAPAAS